MNKPYFRELSNLKDVKIVLSDYDLDQVPTYVKELKKAESLAIVADQVWKVYPPVSFIDVKEVSPPFKVLPDEITTLSGLKKLRITNLDLKELPKNFEKLENLEELDVSFNKLNLSNEIEKLEKLPKLKKLNVTANVLDTLELNDWMKKRPSLDITFKLRMNTP